MALVYGIPNTFFKSGHLHTNLIQLDRPFRYLMSRP
jgi:hypothetical protein